MAKIALDKNLAFLNKFPRYNVSIRGFTDRYGVVEYNWGLSVERTTNVRSYYLENGILSERIVGRAHGESLSVNETNSPVVDDINRRVEMILVDSVGRPVIRQQPVVSGSAE